MQVLFQPPSGFRQLSETQSTHTKARLLACLLELLHSVQHKFWSAIFTNVKIENVTSDNMIGGMLKVSSRITLHKIIKKILPNRLAYVGRIANQKLQCHTIPTVELSWQCHTTPTLRAVSTVTLQCLSHLIFPTLWHSLKNFHNVFSIEVLSYVRL